MHRFACITLIVRWQSRVACDRAKTKKYYNGEVVVIIVFAVVVSGSMNVSESILSSCRKSFCRLALIVCSSNTSTLVSLIFFKCISVSDTFWRCKFSRLFIVKIFIYVHTYVRYGLDSICMQKKIPNNKWASNLERWGFLCVFF